MEIERRDREETGSSRLSDAGKHPHTNHLITAQHTHPALTLTRYHLRRWPAEEQTADRQREVEARDFPRTPPRQRGVSWGTASTRWRDEPRQPFPVPGGWAGSGCLMRRNVGSGWAWVLCCCGSNTAGRSRPGLKGWLGGQPMPGDRAYYTGAAPVS